MKDRLLHLLQWHLRSITFVLVTGYCLTIGRVIDHFKKP